MPDLTKAQKKALKESSRDTFEKNYREEIRAQKKLKSLIYGLTDSKKVL
jgi:hypothetical protein